jgi:hypothetical protein
MRPTQAFAFALLICLPIVPPVHAQSTVRRDKAKPAAPPPAVSSNAAPADSFNTIKFRNLGPSVAGGASPPWWAFQANL